MLACGSNCVSCISDTVCTKCNEASSYSIDVSINGCVLCSSKSGYYEVSDSGVLKCKGIFIVFYSKKTFF